MKNIFLYRTMSFFRTERRSITFLVLLQIFLWPINQIHAQDIVQDPNTVSLSIKARLIKGPYLLYTDNSAEMTVMWQLDRKELCSFQCGVDEANPEKKVSINPYGEDYQYRYTIKNLVAGAQYFYKVIVGDQIYFGSFRSAPPTHQKNIKFMAYGDTRTNVGDHSTVAKGILSAIKQDNDYQTLLLHTGDWVGNGDMESAWDNEYFSIPDVAEMLKHIPVSGCIGNHEASGVLFDKYWPYPYQEDGRYWSYDYGPVHFTIIEHVYESPAYALDAKQLAWIEKDLSETDKQWKIVVFHAPGYTAGGHPGSLSVQQKLQPLLEKYGVDIVLNGHNHFYSRADVNGVAHITVGGGGAPLYDVPADIPKYIKSVRKALHFCKINIKGDTLIFEAVSPDGSVFDKFTIQKPKPLFSFGLIADAQYADKPVSDTRYYRKSLEKMQESVNYFNERSPEFVVQLGDLVDEDNSSYANLDDIFSIYDQLNMPSYHVLGNHDFWHPAGVDISEIPAQYGMGERYYDFSYSSWRFIVLDSDDLTHREPYYDFTTPGKQAEADEMWQSIPEGKYNKHNWNGGVSDEQLAWLGQKLGKASALSEKVIVFSHMPMYPANNHNLWNDMEVIGVLESYDCVAAVISGHNHYGNYGFKDDIHYLTLHGMVETAETNAYAVVEVYDDYLRIDGFGREPDRVLTYPGPKELTFLVTSDTHFGYEAGEKANKAQIEAMNNISEMPYPSEIGGEVGTPSFVIVAGDLTEGDKIPLAWDGSEGFVHSYGLSGTSGEFKYPVFEIRGNHDVFNDENRCSNCIKDLITRRHGNTYYSFDRQGIHFIGLGDVPTNENINWLEEDLKSMDWSNMPVIIFMHRSPNYTGTADADLLNAIYGYNVIGVFFGHAHRSKMYLDWKDPYSGARYDLFSMGSPKEFGAGDSRYFYVVRISDDSMSVVEYGWDRNKGTWRNKYIKKIKTLREIYKAFGLKGQHVTAQ